MLKLPSFLDDLSKSFDGLKEFKDNLTKPFAKLTQAFDKLWEKSKLLSKARKELKILDRNTRGAFRDTITGTVDDLADVEKTLVQDATKDATADIKSEVEDPASINQSQLIELIQLYSCDKPDQCLMEVRQYRQKLATKGIVQLPVELDGTVPRWAEAQEFGTTIKQNVKHPTPSRSASKWEPLDLSKDSISTTTTKIWSLSTPSFTLVLRQWANPGHVCVGFKQGNQIVIYDNSAGGIGSINPKYPKLFTLQEYLSSFTNKGYTIDAAVGMPLQKISL